MTKITMQEVIDGWESPANRKQVKETYDEYYNQAIDDAIGILKGYFGTDELMNHESLLPKLEALKKKP